MVVETSIRTPRPRPKVVSLSPAAAERVKAIMARQGVGFLRVGVKNGGCAGMEYVMDYVGEPALLDEVVEDQGVKILIDAKAVLFLFGSQIDFETTKLAAKFTFRNPNQTDACGCGESVTIIPVASDVAAPAS